MPKPHADRIEKNIRRLVRRRARTMESVALDSGLSRGYFFDVLMGRRSPSLAGLSKIAGALGVDVSELLKP